MKLKFAWIAAIAMILANPVAAQPAGPGDGARG
jgi:hypothetical protein